MSGGPAGRACLALLWCLGAVPAATADDSPRERLIGLATIEIMSELCRLDLTDDQQDAITTARDAMVQQGEADAGDIAAVHDQLAVTLKRQVSEGLCRANGPAVLEFRRQVAALRSK